MKKFILSFLFCLIASFSLQAQNVNIKDVVSYNITSGSTFTYDHVFSEYSRVELNLPFASSFSIVGNHLKFTVERDAFMWYILRNNPNVPFVDLQFSGYSADGSYTVAVIRIIILR